MYKKLARYFLFTALLFTIFFAYSLKDVGFDYDFERFFPEKDPDLTYYNQYREVFGEDNDYFLLGLISVSGDFQDSSFLNKVNVLADSLRNIPEINEVLSPLEYRKPVKTPLGLVQVPYFHLNNPEKYENDIKRWQKEKPQPYYDLTNVENGSVALLITHKSINDNIQGSRELYQRIEELTQRYFPEYKLAGKLKAQPVFVDKMQKELLLFLSISIVLTTLILFLVFRSFKGIIFPLMIVVVSVLWTIGFMTVTGKKLDLLMVMLPTILFVVGMSDVIHFSNKYIEELRHGKLKLKALIKTVREIGLATFLTSLTTAIGFFTLYTLNIAPIREFGVYTGIGVFMAYMVTLLVLPSLYIFTDKPKQSHNIKNKRFWLNLMSRSFRYVFKNRRMILLSSILLTSICIIGTYNIKVNAFLIDDLPEKDPLKQSFVYFDKNFGGVRPLEIAIKSKNDEPLLEREALIEIEKLTNYLDTAYQAGNILSVNTIIKNANQAYHSGNFEYYRIPVSESEMKQIQPIVKAIEKRGGFDMLLDSAGTYGRITAKIKDIGSELTTQKNQEMRKFIKEEIDTDLIDIRLTGTSILIDKSNNLLIGNVLKGMAIALVVVAFLMALLFRSWKMVIITWIPNLIPLLFMAAIMGFFEINLRLSTGIIFTIAFGIAVDDSIHFLSKFKLELDEGKSVLYSLKRAYLSTGKAIILTSLILITGFLSLLLSDFGGTFYTGLLIGITLLIAMVIDLTLLPVLILLIFNDEDSRKKLKKK
ncbi:efflux RND transporter permease subunit [Mangrovivirga sp. M17]|uniref:Efflux RND transporter permease subunit n=1 Tax=Mangrovivirga halotolerans TaxID=2993936 RepID=A0ABT3RVK5_9BACT|nr:efflux RND transporter permease subunit [Mangrovivirga halotolerans]MCX2745653.1 efflux RND transporter permease subunit [Mangrovivirga halotolerans]